MSRRWMRAFGVTLVLFLTLPACDNGSPIDPEPPPCTFTVSPASVSSGADGGTATATVTTGSSCGWTSVSNAPWITIASGASGNGNGTVTLQVAANPTADARTGTVTIGGQTVTVQQAGRTLPPCTVEINPDDEGFGPEGGSGSFTVTAAADCSWTAVSDAPWLRVDSGQGTGNGAVTYTVERNDAIAGRSATIALGGRVFHLVQAGDTSSCQYSVAPIQFTPCMPALTLTASVTTQDGCPWTAAAGAPWIAIESAGSSTGSGQVSFRVGENYDAPRQGVVEIRWPTPTAGQNLQVMQAGCLYAVSVNSFNVVSAGGSRTFNVIQQAVPNSCGGPLQDACVWSAVANVPWITITTPMPSRGDNPVSFTVAPNPTSSVRTGVITVRDQTVTVTQAGQ